MNEKKYAILTGAVIFLCVLGAIVGGMYLNGSGIFKNEYYIKIIFSDTKGLKKGNFVMVEGTSVGRVSDFSLVDEGGTVVIVSIKKNIKISEDSKFSIQSGLMERSVQIVRGKSLRYLKDGQIVTGYSNDFMDVISKIGDKTLSTILSQQNMESFSVTLKEMSTTVTELRKMIAENRQSFSAMTKNLEETSANIKTLFSENQVGIKNVVTLLNESGKNLNTLIVQSASVVNDISVITNKLQKGEGTLGKLISQDTLYKEIKTTSANLKSASENINLLLKRSDTLMIHADSLIGDFKKNPKRYIDLKVF